MPAKFCDDRPCDGLKKAMDVFLAPSSDAQVFELEASFTKVNASVPALERFLTRVSIEYCPFCGTRIDPKWVEERSKLGSKTRG